MSRMKIDGVVGLEHMTRSRKPRVVNPENVARNKYLKEVRSKVSKIAIAKLQRGADGKFKKEFNEEEIDQIGEQMLVWYTTPVVIGKNPATGLDIVEPQLWLKDFAPYFGVSWKRILLFAKRSKHFEECLELAKDLQEARLVKMGVQDRNATMMSIFALKNNSNYSDRREIDYKGTVNHTVETKRESELNAELEELLKHTGVSKSGNSGRSEVEEQHNAVTARSKAARN